MASPASREDPGPRPNLPKNARPNNLEPPKSVSDLPMPSLKIPDVREYRRHGGSEEVVTSQDTGGMIGI